MIDMLLKPVILYDFDGVINPLNFIREWIGEGEPSQLDYILRDPSSWRMRREPVDSIDYFGNDREATVMETASGKDFHIQWSSELVGAINSLISEDTARHVMLTTWEEDSVSKLNPLMGLNISEYISSTSSTGHRFYLNSYDHYQAGKRIALQGWLEDEYGQNKPPIIWFDDVATYYWRHPDSASELGVPFLKAFLTQEDKGISRAEWDQTISIIKTFS